MNVSKGAVAASILGTGGVITGSSLIVKHAISKQDQNNDSLTSPTEVTEEKVSTQQAPTNQSKENIKSLVQEKSGCTIRIKTDSNTETEAKEIDQIEDEDILKNLLETLKIWAQFKTTDSAIHINCLSDQVLVATKGVELNRWTFKVDPK